MASYDVTSLIAELPAETVAELKTQRHIVKHSEGWDALGRSGQAAVIAAHDAMEAAAQEAVEARFTKHAGTWAVAVPADQYTEGGAAEIVKRDGVRKPVILGAKIGERDGKVIAHFTDASTRQAHEYTDVDGVTHHRGRGYVTHHDGAQIWDHA